MELSNGAHTRSPAADNQAAVPGNDLDQSPSRCNRLAVSPHAGAIVAP